MFLLWVYSSTPCMDVLPRTEHCLMLESTGFDAQGHRNIYIPLTQWAFSKRLLLLLARLLVLRRAFDWVRLTLVLFASSFSPAPWLRRSPGDGSHAPESLAPGELLIPQVNLWETRLEGNDGRDDSGKILGVKAIGRLTRVNALQLDAGGKANDGEGLSS